MSKFSPPYEALLRNNLHAVASAYIALTKSTETAFSRSVAADGSFLSRWRRGDTSFRVDTFDGIMGHLSYLWPSAVPWPSDIPRPEPKMLVLTPNKRRTKEATDGEKTE